MEFIRRPWFWFSQRAFALAAALLFMALVIWLAIVAPYNPRAAPAVAAIAAVSAAFSAIANLRQANEVQRQRRLAERPNVVAYFDIDSGGFISVVFENLGNSPARDLRLRFEPDPIDSRGRPLSKVSVFAYPITFLPQGKQFRQLVEFGPRFFAEGRPRAFSITSSYRSADGKQTYGETHQHDLEYLAEAVLPRKSTEGWLEVIANNIKGLKETH